ncbi:MAG TPA: hypothetical protein DCY20_09075, partial [Firmicutes bacterium]|nr:hypothetical protein [Bacillota bacterium]
MKHKVMKWVSGLTLATVIGCMATTTVLNYSKTTERVNETQVNLLEQPEFAELLISSSQYVFNKDTCEKWYTGGCYDGDYQLNNTLQEVDYYAVKDNKDVLSRDGIYLETLFKNEDINRDMATLDEQYQMWVKLKFTEEGTVIEDSNGFNDIVLKTLKNKVEMQDFYYETSAEESENKSLTGFEIAFGVPKLLKQNGQIMNYYYYEKEQAYLVSSVVWIGFMILTSTIATLLLPYQALKEWRIFKYSLRMPLELRILFTIACGFALMGAPFALIGTELGYFKEILNVAIGEAASDPILMSLNIIAWVALGVASAIHMLFIKQFFIEGFVDTILNHSLLGWIYKKMKRLINRSAEPTNKTTIKESKMIAVDVTPLVETATELKAYATQNYQDEQLLAYTETIENWALSNQMTPFDLNKLLAEISASLSSDDFMIRTKLNQNPIMIEQRYGVIKTECFNILNELSAVSLPGSRCYIESYQTKQEAGL